MLLYSNFLNWILWLSKLKMSGKWNWIELLYIAKDEGGGCDLVGFGYFQICLIFIFDFNSFFCSWLGCVLWLVLVFLRYLVSFFFFPLFLYVAMTTVTWFRDLGKDCLSVAPLLLPSQILQISWWIYMF